MQLPNQWLWDMVDEFVYQFQSFCQYRAKMKSKTEQEIALLKQFDQVATLDYVFFFLSLVEYLQFFERNTTTLKWQFFFSVYILSL